MYIDTVYEATDELYDTLQRLVPQLGPHKVGPSREELVELIRSEATTLLIAREPNVNGPIVGVLSLTVYRAPTGVRSIIEDVVVDENMRRRGIGEALVRRGIEVARESGAEGVSLTSNPKREAANLLYQSMGFALRQTNPYYYKLT